jgi:hypothetical protein
MKNLIFGVLFLPALVVAQQQGPVRVEKPVICDHTEAVLETIINEWKERPIWGSMKEDSRILLTANPETQTWSLLQFDDKYACLIEAGQGYHFGIKGT